jgi:uncharacterized FlaG/YvyC family protein
MSEVGDFESFMGPAPSESTEKNDEVFSEQMRKAQQAQQQLQKEEGQAKQNDNQLAQIIVAFLGQEGNTDLFLLISRCVAQNIPSEIIIAVLSLVDQRSSQEIHKMIEGFENKPQTALTVQDHHSFKSLDPNLRKQIDGWIQNVQHAIFHKPHQSAETLILKSVDKQTNEVVRQLSPVFLQLSTFILRNYLAKHSVQIDFERIRDFMQNIYIKIIKDLENLIAGQKKLSQSE